jgi:hypothetical protein
MIFCAATQHRTSLLLTVDESRSSGVGRVHIDDRWLLRVFERLGVAALSGPSTQCEATITGSKVHRIRSAFLLPILDTYRFDV